MGVRAGQRTRLMRHKVRDWSKRYLPSEIIGTITAVLAAGISFFLTGNPVITAFSGTWGENLGYYGAIISRDFIENKKKGLRPIKTIRNLVIEFGPSEVLDSFILRPFFMYTFPIILSDLTLGIIVGKLAADITFYIPTIFAYEMRKKHIKE